jgi:hypothetical protein
MKAQWRRKAKWINSRIVNRGYRQCLLGASLLLSAGLAIGCGELPDDATAEEAAALSTVEDGVCGKAHDPERDRDHAFHPRCEHYRHQRSYHRRKVGNAQLAARTMLDSQAGVVLEVTTGTFDDGSVAPGAIEKLAVSITRPNGKHRDELTFKPRTDTGFFSTSLGSLIHGQALTVDATISGISRGKDRVSVDDQVVYRPDLTVSHVDVPRSAAFGLPTSIAATISETMGDLGAKADCILSSDGAVVDRVAGIWVDAGGVVTCHFSHTFTALGPHAIRVDVANVQPGDYDTTNNHGDAALVVTPEFVFSAAAYDASYAGIDVNEVLDVAGNTLYRENNTWSGALQSASVSGGWEVPVSFPLKSVSARASAGGSTWSLIELTDIAADAADGQATCAARGDATGFNWITLCTSGVDGAGTTSVNVSAFAGEVTYHSDGACLQATSFSDCSGGFTWNSGTSFQWATRHPYGQGLTLTVAVSDAAGMTLEASPTVSLAAYTSRYDVPRTCERQPDQTQHCYTHLYGETGVSGSVGR